MRHDSFEREIQPFTDFEYYLVQSLNQTASLFHNIFLSTNNKLVLTFFELYAFIILTSTLVLGINTL